MSGMIYFNTKEDTAKVLHGYLYLKFVRNGGVKKRGYLDDVECSCLDT